MTSVSTYWRTIRHLRREQIFARIARLLPARPASGGPPPPRRGVSAPFAGLIAHPGHGREQAGFRLLNQSARIEHAADWNSPERSRLWLYNLHYFDWLRDPGAAQRIADDAAWIDRWIADNPSGYGVGWEPYPVSMRIVNWIGWFLTTGAVTDARLASLAVQTRHLANRLEYHLLGNHLLANAKALTFAGAFFDSQEADRWRNIGLDLLRRELKEQVLADGAHFELSAMYHSLVLEDLLDLIELRQSFPGALAKPLTAIDVAGLASRMARWLRQVSHPDGQIPYFNDAAMGIAPSPAELFDHAAAVGVDIQAPTASLAVLAPSGYAVFSRPPFHLVFDCGRIGPDYLPGHAHADTLSFELSIGEERVITNSGTSTYASGPARDWERSTAAHATIEIDRTSSAEVWAGFRVGRRPNVTPVRIGSADGADWAECSHDGYAHLRGSPIHSRRIEVSETAVAVRDSIDGSGVHEVRGIFPLHPGTALERMNERHFRLKTGTGRAVEMMIDGQVDVVVGDGQFAPEFNLVVPRAVVAWRRIGQLPLSVTTRLVVTDR